MGKTLRHPLTAYQATARLRGPTQRCQKAVNGKGSNHQQHDERVAECQALGSILRMSQEPNAQKYREGATGSRSASTPDSRRSSEHRPGFPLVATRRLLRTCRLNNRHRYLGCVRRPAWRARAAQLPSSSLALSHEMPDACRCGLNRRSASKMGALWLDLETLREEIRIASRDGSLQTAAQQSPPENKSWMKRHPVWSGLIVGAGVGAAVGAVSCSGGCYLIGAGGAAIVGSCYGAGAGALIGWGVGRAK